MTPCLHYPTRTTAFCKVKTFYVCISRWRSNFCFCGLMYFLHDISPTYPLSTKTNFKRTKRSVLHQKLNLLQKYGELSVPEELSRLSLLTLLDGECGLAARVVLSRGGLYICMLADLLWVVAMETIDVSCMVGCVRNGLKLSTLPQPLTQVQAVLCQLLVDQTYLRSSVTISVE